MDFVVIAATTFHGSRYVIVEVNLGRHRHLFRNGHTVQDLMSVPDEIRMWWKSS